jgi:hypothetical protein
MTAGVCTVARMLKPDVKGSISEQTHFFQFALDDISVFSGSILVKPTQ